MNPLEAVTLEDLWRFYGDSKRKLYGVDYYLYLKKKLSAYFLGPDHPLPSDGFQGMYPGFDPAVFEEIFDKKLKEHFLIGFTTRPDLSHKLAREDRRDELLEAAKVRMFQKAINIIKNWSFKKEDGCPDLGKNYDVIEKNYFFTADFYEAIYRFISKPEFDKSIRDKAFPKDKNDGIRKSLITGMNDDSKENLDFIRKFLVYSSSLRLQGQSEKWTDDPTCFVWCAVEKEIIKHLSNLRDPDPPKQEPKKENHMSGFQYLACQIFQKGFPEKIMSEPGLAWTKYFLYLYYLICYGFKPWSSDPKKQSRRMFPLIEGQLGIKSGMQQFLSDFWNGKDNGGDNVKLGLIQKVDLEWKNNETFRNYFDLLCDIVKIRSKECHGFTDKDSKDVINYIIIKWLMPPVHEQWMKKSHYLKIQVAELNRDKLSSIVDEFRNVCNPVNISDDSEYSNTINAFNELPAFIDWILQQTIAKNQQAHTELNVLWRNFAIYSLHRCTFQCDANDKNACNTTDVCNAEKNGNLVVVDNADYIVKTFFDGQTVIDGQTDIKKMSENIVKSIDDEIKKFIEKFIKDYSSIRVINEKQIERCLNYITLRIQCKWSGVSYFSKCEETESAHESEELKFDREALDSKDYVSEVEDYFYNPC